MGNQEIEKEEISLVNIENEDNQLDYDKMYFADLRKVYQTMGKLTLFVFLGVMLINVVMSGVPWWAIVLLIGGALLLVAFVFYDVKYMLGVKKNPFMLFHERKIFRYYNEYEGNKEIDITKIKEIKIYNRVKPEETFLLEIFVENQKDEENVNVSGYTQATIDEMLEHILQFNSKISITKNREEKTKQNKKG